MFPVWRHGSRTKGLSRVPPSKTEGHRGTSSHGTNNGELPVHPHSPGSSRLSWKDQTTLRMFGQSADSSLLPAAHQCPSEFLPVLQFPPALPR